MKELDFTKARELSTKIRRALGCRVSTPIALKGEDAEEPSPDAASTVICKIKVASATLTDSHCAVVDGSPCPLRLPVEKVKIDQFLT